MLDRSEDTSRMVDMGAIQDADKITLQELYDTLEFLQDRLNDPKSDKDAVNKAITNTLNLIARFTPPQKTAKTQ